MAREGIEVAAQRHDVDGCVRCPLRTVDEDHRTVLMRDVGHLPHRVDSTESVGDVRKSHHPSAVGE